MKRRKRLEREEPKNKKGDKKLDHLELERKRRRSLEKIYILSYPR